MKNHLYTFDGKVYRQSTGGPIGVELTGILARIVMIWWDKKYLEKLRNLDINLMLYKRYVDDQNSAVRALKPGVRYRDGKLVVEVDAVEDDQLIRPDVRTPAITQHCPNLTGAAPLRRNSSTICTEPLRRCGELEP